jgi:repressor of nif and glnA expression
MVEIENMIPRRFTAMLKYEYTTIDPISVMISQGNTKVTEVIKTGNGSITGNIREFHMEAESTVFGVVEELNSSGFTGVLDVGAPNTPLLGVPVTPDYQGFAMIGGTNPVAAILESGRSAEVQSMKGLIDISKINYLSDY